MRNVKHVYILRLDLIMLIFISLSFYLLSSIIVFKIKIVFVSVSPSKCNFVDILRSLIALILEYCIL